MEELNSKRRVMNIDDGSMRLPFNIVKVIFSKLAISNLSVCRLVCKTWNDFVINYASSYRFVPNVFFLCTCDILPSNCNCNCNSRCDMTRECNFKIHCIDIDTMSCVGSFGFEDDHNHSTVSIVSSCHALLLISKLIDTDDLCEGILNPMTNEFLELPEREYDESSPYYGFGFNPKTKQYKLFRVTERDRYEFYSIMEIMRFGDRSETKEEWRHFKCPPISFDDHGAYLNGVIYWMGKEKGKAYVIYALDVETEQMELVADLEVGPHNFRYNGYIATLNKSVYAYVAIVGPCCTKIQIWTMQGKEGWIREFVVYDEVSRGLRMPMQMVKVLKDGERWFFVEGNILCCDKTGMNIKIESLWNSKIETRFDGLCQIESLNFGSIQNILAGYQ